MSTATDMLAAYINAETKVLRGQSVDFGGRRLTLADLAEIRAGRREWQRVVDAEQGASHNAFDHALADFSDAATDGGFRGAA